MNFQHLITLKEALQNAAKKAGFSLELGQIELEPPKLLAHGHFATNIALRLSKDAGHPPRDVAQAIVDALESNLIAKAEVAGPGFINLFIEQKFYSNELSKVSQNLDELIQKTFAGEKGKHMVIDYSHPNIAKPMGVHHLLSTIIGDSIKKLYRRLGYKVTADNFIGDMGTQFGKLIHAIKTWGDMAEIEKNPIPVLHQLYIKFHIEADKDVELDDAGRAEYKKFEDGDAENRALWEKIKHWSLMEIQPIYDRLQVSFDYMNGESFYEDKMEPILKAGRDSGVIIDGEKGAWIIPSENPDQPPAIVRKKDGATLYLTRDLARTKYWEDTWSPDVMVVVTDIAQILHFKQVFEAVEKLKLTDANNVHVAFGRMLGMSTRKGNLVLLNDLLDEAEARAKALADEKAAELTDEERRELARILGIGSIKYSILHQNRANNMTFDWDKMLAFEGNSAPYLLYTATRANSVLQKSGMSETEIAQADASFSLEEEVAVAIKLLMYSDALYRAADEFKPNHVANYLYELAQLYNAFYNGNSILQAETDSLKKSRLKLTAAVVAVMRDGLGILGLELPKKM